MSDLSEAIFDMKKQLFEGIQAQKALGTAYANEAAILKKANELTDQVFIELIKEEYKAGQISTQRFAHIIRRMIPEASELKRLLPQIRRALLEAGMPMADYLNLLHELRNELQSDELSRILEEGSETIGLDGDGLIEEIKRNPTQAAELIYLASEIRKGGGDEALLSDIMVEYVEHIGQKMAKDASESGDENGDAEVKELMNNVESSVLKKLTEMNVNAEVISRMETRLNEKMESVLDRMRVEWLKNQSAQTTKEAPKMLSVLQTLEHNVGDDDEMSEVLQEIRAEVESGKIEENNFSQIHKEINQIKKRRREALEGRGMPEGVLTSEEVMFVLEKEIARADRYASPLSALAFAFVSAKPHRQRHKSRNHQQGRPGNRLGHALHHLPFHGLHCADRKEQNARAAAHGPIRRGQESAITRPPSAPFQTAGCKGRTGATARGRRRRQLRSQPDTDGPNLCQTSGAETFGHGLARQKHSGSFLAHHVWINCLRRDRVCQENSSP